MAAITTIMNWAALILVIEHHDPAFKYLFADDGLATRAVLKTQEALSNLDSARNVLRFFVKRIPCDCLDEMKQERLKHEKTGLCIGCKKSILDAALFNCTGCGFAKYCSNECQVTDWANHKQSCKLFRKSAKAKKKAANKSDKDGDDNKHTKPKAIEEVDKSDSKPTANEL